VTINGTTNGNFAGIIFNGYGSSGPLTFNKTGPGTQTLAGANTYTGQRLSATGRCWSTDHWPPAVLSP